MSERERESHRVIAKENQRERDRAKVSERERESDRVIAKENQRESERERER